jgi:hypothetical protein
VRGENRCWLSAARTLTDRHRVLGDDHPNTLMTAAGLAGAYEAAGRLSEALTLYEQTFARAESALGVDHPLTGEVHRKLQTCRAARGA